nr:RNA-directed DNA polymerase, eukaryota [Tanacetum cinerariifolium]
LIDLPIGGRYYNWMNKAGTKLSKLDRFVISEGIHEDIPDIRVMAIDRMWSDHTPILLHAMKSNFSPSHFKFFNSWLNRDGFDDLIKSKWSTLEAPNDSRILSLTSLDRDSLEKHISLDEIKTAVWDCSRNNALVLIVYRSMPQGANSSFFTLFLSPFLFILAMEGLHGAMSNLVNSGLIRGGLKHWYLKGFQPCPPSKVALEVFPSPNGHWVKVIKALHGKEGGLDHQGCNFNSSWSRIVKADIGIQNIAYLRELLLEINLDLNSQDDTCILSMVNDGVFSVRSFQPCPPSKVALEVFPSPNAHWVKVIKALHGQEGGLDHQGCNFNSSWSRIVKADIGIQNIAYLRELLLEMSLDLNSQDDTCILSMVNDGVFSVRSIRRVIDSKLLPSMLPATN